jgi:DNA-binding beta-propeller fold protein YncE
MRTTIVARSLFVLAIAAAAALNPGCDCSSDIGTDPMGTACEMSSDCPPGQTCRDGVCRRPSGGSDAGPGVDTGMPMCGTEPSACPCEDPMCVSHEIGVGTDTPFDLMMDDNDGVGLDPEGALILDSRSINTNVIWIANTGEGTVSKVDTTTFVELARYRTGPSGSGNDPSRTSVNTAGDVFVANRGGHSVTRISVLGDECPDRNADGMVLTSHGPTEILDWGTDECVVWHTDLPGTYIRAAAAQDIPGLDGTLQEFVWIGDWTGARAIKLDGATGAVLIDTAAPSNPYGFALDARGQLWVSHQSQNAIGRLDTTRCVDAATCADPVCMGEGAGDTCVKQVIPAGSNPYGITVDFRQRVWAGGDDVKRYDPMAPVGARWSRNTAGGTFFHGIAADGSGWVWAAGYSLGVYRVNADDPSMAAYVAGTGQSSKGMAVDQDGKIWSINQGHNNATVIVPGGGIGAETVTTGVAPLIVSPYTYSDMTGLQLRLATNPRGYYRRTFEGCDPTTSDGTDWLQLYWDGDAPPGTALHFRVRTAATPAELGAATWVNVANVPPDVSPADVFAALMAAMVAPQRYLEVEVGLEAMRSSTMEAITPRVRSFMVSHTCRPMFG